MDATLSSGPARVIASGQATTFHGHGLTLEIALPGAGAYTVALRFVDEPQAPGPAARSQVEPWGITIDLVNFRDVAGRGSGEPVLLGEAGGALYFLHFRVWWAGRTPDPTVHYTVFAASAADVGWAGAGNAPDGDGGSR
jgi:hypothetical protein